jgi:hypothetical protein
MQALLSGHLKASSDILLFRHWHGSTVVARWQPRQLRSPATQTPLLVITSATAPMSNQSPAARIDASFKTSQDQAAFSGSFKLVRATQPQVQPASTP